MAAEPSGRLARAKVNLCLHVTGRRPDGYHLLDSLVVFPELGDEVRAEPAAGLSLACEGPRAGEIDAGPGNLVWQAAAAMAAAAPGRGAALTLVKRLPVAAGIGGGSADAAATILALEALWDVRLPPDRRAALALRLGADLPVCLGGRPARMQGIGDALTSAPKLPDFWLVLVNPGVALPTREVFRRLGSFGAAAEPPPEGFADVAGLARWLAGQRNDLEAPARSLCPEVSSVLAALQAEPGIRLARMSGSGPTCFGLAEAAGAAEAAAAAIGARHPGWWVAAAPVQAPA
jgi:4-diphosphocytidyl-2-C-methyl-D-erythritol kinase